MKVSSGIQEEQRPLKQGEKIRKHRKLIVSENLTQLEERYNSLLRQGWKIDPDFKDRLSLIGHLKAISENRPVTLGMLREEIVDLNQENRQLRQENKELRERLESLRGLPAPLEEIHAPDQS